MTESRPKGLMLNNVAVRDHERELFSIDATVPPGEILTVMGPSGSGKSTLLNLVSGFLPQAFSYTGRVLLDGVDMTQAPPEERHVGLMFQDPLLFPHMSVEDNLLFALPKDGSKDERCQKVRAALAAVNMEELGSRDPMTLSGGQQSRISLIRLLLSEPKALLLDEPFSALDSGLKEKVRDFVFSQVRRRQLPTILVTHDEADAYHAGGNLRTI